MHRGEILRVALELVLLYSHSKSFRVPGNILMRRSKSTEARAALRFKLSPTKSGTPVVVRSRVILQVRLYLQVLLVALATNDGPPNSLSQKQRA